MVVGKLANKVTGKKESDDFVYNPDERDPSNLESSGESVANAKDEEESSEEEGHSNSTDDFGTTTNPSREESDAFVDILARKLTRGVKVWRAVVSVMLLVTAVLVTVLAYIFLTKEETNNFEKSVRL